MPTGKKLLCKLQNNKLTLTLTLTLTTDSDSDSDY